MRKSLILVFAALTIIAFAASATTVTTDELLRIGLQPIKEGTEIVDFELQDLTGATRRLSDFKGKVVFLNFWATWCGPCRIEMPFLQEVHEKWAGKGLVLQAVNVQENPTTVIRFVEDGGYTFPILLSPGNDVPLAYNIRGIPATFFIDVDGAIRDIKVGAFLGAEEIESKLAKIMP